MNIISDLYETKISTTNSHILLNDTITITVELIDFNGARVNRNNVTITCNKGRFTNNSQSYTGNTVNGVLSVDYKASENGVVTFQCKNVSYEIFVFGKKVMRIHTTNGGDRNLIIDEYNRTCFFPYYYSGSFSLSTAYSSMKIIESNIIPTQYRPIASVRTPIYNSNAVCIVSEEGNIYIRSVQNSGTISNATITFQWTY